MQNNENNLNFSNSNAPLIRVEQKDGQQLVSARELYAFLEVKTDFTDWCKRMFEYGFVENQDFNLLKFEEVRFEGNRQVKRIVIDYALTLDTAKEIAMIQRSEKGKQARQYFIECEKELRQVQKTESYQLLPSDFQKIFNKLDLLEETNKKFQERIFRLENILDSRTYIPHKNAESLTKYHVYFAFNPDNNLTKIGRSHDIEARLKTFKATSPKIEIVLVINVANLKVSCELETFLHTLFANKHHNNELFELKDSDFKALELLKDAIEYFN